MNTLAESYNLGIRVLDLCSGVYVRVLHVVSLIYEPRVRVSMQSSLLARLLAMGFHSLKLLEVSCSMHIPRAPNWKVVLQLPRLDSLLSRQ